MAKSPSRKAKSIEPIVSQWANEQLNKMSWKNTLEQESLNKIIETALKNALSKEGGVGGCRVDAQLMLKFGSKEIPVMLEYKGTKGDLEVLDKHNLINIKTDKNEYDFKTISKKAVNGAVYYASVILSTTTNPYREIMAIGVNGWKDETEHTHYEVKAYLLNAENPNMPIFFTESSDLSFLNQEPERIFGQIEDCQKTPEELNRKHRQDEDRLEKVLKELNQHLRDESRIQVNHRISVVTPCIMAGLGVKNPDGSYKVEPLKLDELRGSQEEGETDGDKIYRKVVQFLKARNIPDIKQKHIQDSLKTTLLHQRLGLVDESLGCSPLKSAYTKVFENIIPAYHLSGILDFTGKLFNVMNDWVAVPDGDQNDVVLTPRYVTDLMAQLTEVDRNSYVWDWALGSGGFLISAMNLMLQDNKNNAKSEKERLEKDRKIKSEQLLGVEKLPDIYILAVLNMILMNDGSTNIINEDSLTEYNGNYAYNANDEFPANVFLLNPPYSNDGNGMIFVQKAFEKMRAGKGAVIIQDSAGTGKAVEFNKKILKNNRLLASIKMPADLFKASVQTSIYLFEIGKQHRENDYVKFIDFSDDGYTRTNRKKASSNLSGEAIARPRYQELISVVKNGITPECQFFKEGENYIQDKIAIEKSEDPQNTTEKNAEVRENNAKVGCDWNFTQHKKINTKPTLADFKKTVADYLAWEVSQLLKQDNSQGK